MKKIILLTLPVLLSACMLSKTPAQDENTQSIPTISNEVAQQPTTPETPKEPAKKPTPTQPVKKTEVKNTKTDPKTDEMTEEHAKISNERVQNILRQPSLFVGS